MFPNFISNTVVYPEAMTFKYPHGSKNIFWQKIFFMATYMALNHSCILVS